MCDCICVCKSQLLIHVAATRTLSSSVIEVTSCHAFRISIQHVHIDEPRRVRLRSGDDVLDGGAASEDIDARIYAISSEAGNVIYHVNNNKPISKRASEELCTYAMTSLTQNGASSTARAHESTRGERDVDAERVNPRNVTITLNPFTDDHHGDEHVSHA